MGNMTVNTNTMAINIKGTDKVLQKQPSQDRTATVDKMPGNNANAETFRAARTRLENSVSLENVISSQSRIRDTGGAREMINNLKLNILSQPSASMSAQANQAPQRILQLLS